jgi:hypothetical protein
VAEWFRSLTSNYLPVIAVGSNPAMELRILSSEKVSSWLTCKAETLPYGLYCESATNNKKYEYLTEDCHISRVRARVCMLCCFGP